MRLLFAIAILSSICFMLTSEQSIPTTDPASKIIPLKKITVAHNAIEAKMISPTAQVMTSEKRPIDEFWEEHQERWDSILYEAIDRLDPEKASMILKNYYLERKRRTSELGRLIKSRASERLWKIEDERNENNLKRIFQEHYEAVKADHDAFNESIRYSHPDGLDEIAIEL